MLVLSGVRGRMDEREDDDEEQDHLGWHEGTAGREDGKDGEVDEVTGKGSNLCLGVSLYMQVVCKGTRSYIGCVPDRSLRQSVVIPCQ